MTRSARLALLALIPLAPALAEASLGEHGDPIAPVILGATSILFFALIGRFGARALGQPPVLGELVMGVALGNLALLVGYDLVIVLREGPALFDTIDFSFHGHAISEAGQLAFASDSHNPALRVLQGPDGAEILQVAHVIDVFGRYGALFLLFYVGLETSLDELRAVGGESTRVAVSGVVAPFLLGLVALWLLLPEQPLETQLFVASTLAATSVGITASVLNDLGRQHSQEARVILGAAVIDDVLGLVLLAIVAGIVITGGAAVGDVLLVVLRAAAFVIGVVYLGPPLLRLYIRAARHLRMLEEKLLIAIIFAMGLAWIANLFGLAPIMGAFAAGVILKDEHFHFWDASERRRYKLREMIMPIELILVPFFFVLMGMQVKLEGFADWQVIGLSLALLVAATAGKLLSGLTVDRGTSRWVVGIGMLPRGEVGLVFAAIGRGLGVIGDAVFSAIVMMVVITTLATPILLKLAYRRLP